MGTQQPRKPAGTPVGRQFAPTKHDEADIDLSAPPKSKAREPEMRVLSNGTREWRLHGTRHREDGPAVEYADGCREWYRHGQLHREDGPAIERANGTSEWYRHGQLHREDGPAIEYADGTREWYRDGKLVSREEA